MLLVAGPLKLGRLRSSQLPVLLTPCRGDHNKTGYGYLAIDRWTFSAFWQLRSSIETTLSSVAETDILH